MHNNIYKLFIVVICAVVVAIFTIVLLDNNDDTKVRPFTTPQKKQAETIENKNKDSAKGITYKSSAKSTSKDSTAYADKTYVEVCDPDGWTNVRARPTVNSTILRRIDNGEIIEVSIAYVNGMQSNWLYVSKYRGYVHNSKIRIIN